MHLFVNTAVVYGISLFVNIINELVYFHGRYGIFNVFNW